MTVHQNVDPAVAPDVAMQMIGFGMSIPGAAGSSLYGHPCATKATSIAAIDWVSYSRPIRRIKGMRTSRGLTSALQFTDEHRSEACVYQRFCCRVVALGHATVFTAEV